MAAEATPTDTAASALNASTDAATIATAATTATDSAVTIVTIDDLYKWFGILADADQDAGKVSAFGVRMCVCVWMCVWVCGRMNRREYDLYSNAFLLFGVQEASSFSIVLFVCLFFFIMSWC